MWPTEKSNYAQKQGEAIKCSYMAFTRLQVSGFAEEEEEEESKSIRLQTQMRLAMKETRYVNVDTIYTRLHSILIQSGYSSSLCNMYNV